MTSFCLSLRLWTGWIFLLITLDVFILLPFLLFCHHFNKFSIFGEKPNLCCTSQTLDSLIWYLVPFLSSLVVLTGLLDFYSLFIASFKYMQGKSPFRIFFTFICFFLFLKYISFFFLKLKTHRTILRKIIIIIITIYIWAEGLSQGNMIDSGYKQINSFFKIIIFL